MGSSPKTTHLEDSLRLIHSPSFDEDFLDIGLALPFKDEHHVNLLLRKSI